MKKIIVINGPNLNLVGKREPEIYGNVSFEEYFAELVALFPKVELTYFQSNAEGALVDKIQEVGFSFDGVVLNAGAYTHTSLAIADAIGAVTSPVVEVHISNPAAREAFRHHSFLARVVVGSIAGFGMEGYRLAVDFLAKR